MDDDSSEASFRSLCWEPAELSSGIVSSRTSLESSEAPVIPWLPRNVPSHSSSIMCREEFESHPARYVSPTEKAETKPDLHERHGTKTCSRTRWIKKLLEGSNTERHSILYGYTMSLVLEKDRAVALEILRWVTYAARPLYAWELLEAIAFRMGINLSEPEIVRICGGLLSTTEDGRVCFVHLSLRDYLLSQSIDDDILGWNAVSGASHEMITITCFGILGFTDLRDSLKNSAAVKPRDILYNECRHTLRIYAKQYWRFHYTHAEPHSYCLPGMLHDRLKSSWMQGYETFASSFTQDQEWTFPDTKSRGFSKSGAMEFINAVLKEGARSGMVKLVKLELEMGARSNASDSLGMTALHYAAAAGNCEVIKLLIDYGGNVNMTSNSGEIPLSLAVANRHVEAVKLLQARGLTSANNNSGAHQNKNGSVLAQASHQKLSLRMLLTSYCSDCGDIRSHYVLSRLPNEETDDELWPPIHVTDQSVPQAKCAHSAMQENSQLHYGTIISEQRTMLKWFPGINMYKALGVAAKSGIDDVLKLLFLAGNDIEFLKKDGSLSRLMSEMSIS